MVYRIFVEQLTGTTNTGTVDPLNAIADVCQEQDLWLHVDGAYGAAAVLTEHGRGLLQGMERAHSLVLDPHKWLFQPFDIGCCLVRGTGWISEWKNTGSLSGTDFLAADVLVGNGSNSNSPNVQSCAVAGTSTNRRSATRATPG